MTEVEPLVVGIDGSEASARALRWALQEGRRRRAPVHAITVWESPAVLSGPAPILTQPDLTPNRVREQHWHDLTDVVEACVAGASTPELTTELVEGNAAEVLVNRAAHACMLVLGDRGRGRMSGSTLGSVALHCIHKAHCPVLILPAGMGSANHPGDAQPRAAIDPVLG